MKRLLLLLAAGSLVLSASDTIVGSKHNLSSVTGSYGTTSGEKQLCKFCHTPHGADSGATRQIPLWGHDNSTIDYTAYGISAAAATNGSGSTLACLSCHDGSIAMSSNTNVLVKDSSETALSAFGTVAASTSWDAEFKMIDSKRKGDLGAQHPVNKAYPMTASYMVALTAMTGATKPVFFAPDNTKIRNPSTYTGTSAYVQCSSCHAVHGSSIAYTDGTAGRFMLNVSMDGSALCLACHRK